MKLYTEEQVKLLLDKMSLVTERKNLGVSANFRHRAIEIENLIKSETPIELPNDEEIEDNAKNYANLIGNKNGTSIFDYVRGAKWMRNKILNK